jgi:hypothetical protein
MRPGRAIVCGTGDLELFEFREITKARLDRAFYISVSTLCGAYRVSRDLPDGREERYRRYKKNYNIIVCYE